MKIQKILKSINLKFSIIILIIISLIISCNLNDDFDYLKKPSLLKQNIKPIPGSNNINLIYDKEKNVISINNGETWLDAYNNPFFQFFNYDDNIAFTSITKHLISATLNNNYCSYSIDNEDNNSLSLEYPCFETHYSSNTWFYFTINFELYKFDNVILDNEDNIISLDNGLTWLPHWVLDDNLNSIYPANPYFNFSFYNEPNLFTAESNSYDLYDVELLNNYCYYFTSGETDSITIEYDCISEHILNTDYFLMKIKYLD